MKCTTSIASEQRAAAAALTGTPPRRKLKTFRVSFCVRDFYFREIEAASPQAAIARAQKLYASHHEEAFDFHCSDGGDGEWDAEEVRP